MPNKNYVKGRAAEYRTMMELQREGYNTLRAAGSHGVFDVIAWDNIGYKMVQVKCEKGATKEELEALVDEVVPHNAQKLIHLWKKVGGKMQLFVTVIAFLVLSASSVLGEDPCIETPYIAMTGIDWIGCEH